MLIAYDMFKKKCSIISRYIPKTTTTSIKENKMELYASLNMQLILIESEDENSILKKVQDEFYLYFGKYENDPRLTDIYNKTFSSLKEELINTISKEINKIGAVSENIVNRMSDSLSYDDMYHVKKLHRTPKVYQEKHR
jgi:tetrahydromethanopterin S-methyltransferase subunit A